MARKVLKKKVVKKPIIKKKAAVVRRPPPPRIPASLVSQQCQDCNKKMPELPLVPRGEAQSHGAVCGPCLRGEDPDAEEEELENEELDEYDPADDDEDNEIEYEDEEVFEENDSF